MKRRVLAILVVGAAALWPGSGSGGWQTFTAIDGLGGNSVGQILEDRSGNIWAVGTKLYPFPVSRYDGWRWTTFPVDSDRLFEDSDGSIWASTWAGAARFDGVRWTEFARPDRPFYYSVALLENRPGSVWAAGWGGIGHYDETGWTEYRPGDELPEGFIDFMVADAAGDVFACGHRPDRNGVWVIRFKDGSWSTIASVERVRYGPLTPFQAVYADRAGNVWVLSDFGIDRWNGEAWDFPLTDRFFTSGSLRPTTVFEDYDGTLWIGTRAGLRHLQNGVLTPVDVQTNRIIGQVFRSNRSGLWVTWQDWTMNVGGISNLDHGVWKIVTTIENVHSPGLIGKLLEDRQRRIWFTVEVTPPEGYAFMYDGFVLNRFSAADGYFGGTPTTGLVDRVGNVWLGSSYRGVCRSDGADFSIVPVPESPRGIRVSINDRSGNLWFGTNSQGLFHFDGVSWTHYDQTNVLSGKDVYAMLEDRGGNIWISVLQQSNGSIGTLQRFDGRTWTTYGDDVLPRGRVESMIQGNDGVYWFGSSGGLVRHDGVHWALLSAADGVPDEHLSPELKDSSGALWFSYPGGVARFDGSAWQDFRTGTDLPLPLTGRMIEDGSGNVWVSLYTLDGGDTLASAASGLTVPGQRRGDPAARQFTIARGDTVDYASAACRWDGTSWTWYPRIAGEMTAVDAGGGVWCGSNRFDGTTWTAFPNAYGWRTIQDSRGSVWFGSSSGASRFDGYHWTHYGQASGLPVSSAAALVEDRSGAIWFLGSLSYSELAIVRYRPDRVSSRSIFLSRPPRLTTDPSASAAFTGAFGETRGVEFSTSFDDGPWSPWSAVGSWGAAGLLDGTHVLAVRSHDADWNIETSPASLRFEVDATPPDPVLESPAFGSAVRGLVEVAGVAADPRFLRYRLELRAAGATSWNPPAASVIAESHAPVPRGALAMWDTSVLPDGVYDLRLSVTDTLGVTGTDQVTVAVDNLEPFFDRTTPALVTAADGGDVYTTNSEVHLYVPPHGFPQDAVVVITPLADGSVPDTLENGATRAGAGWELSWEVPLRKTATIDLAVSGAAPPEGGDDRAIYRSVKDGPWVRLGGSPDAAGVRLSTAVTGPGRYAVFAEAGPVRGSRTLSSLSFTPRVFSPTGTYADRQVAIGFHLGTAGPVSIKVYDPSGRLVRELRDGAVMGAGSQLVRWDGHDREGAVVGDGLYLVTVEAFGEVRKKTLAVVR